MPNASLVLIQFQLLPAQSLRSVYDEGHGLSFAAGTNFLACSAHQQHNEASSTTLATLSLRRHLASPLPGLGSPGLSTWGSVQPEFPHSSCSHWWGLEKQREKPSVTLGRMGGCWLKAKDLRPWLPVRLWTRRVHGRLALNPITSRQSPWGGPSRHGTCWGCSIKGVKTMSCCGIEESCMRKKIDTPEIKQTSQKFQRKTTAPGVSHDDQFQFI